MKKIISDVCAITANLDCERCVVDYVMFAMSHCPYLQHRSLSVLNISVEQFDFKELVDLTIQKHKMLIVKETFSDD